MTSRRPVLVGLATTLVASRSAWAQGGAVTGTWTGALEVGSQRLRLKFDFDADGTATLYSLDQGGNPIPAQAASLTPERIEIGVAAVRGSFRGKLVSPDRIEGVWQQGADLPLVLLRGEAGLAATPRELEPLTQQLLEAQMRESGMPALAAAAVRKGSVARKWVAGERAAASGVAVTAADLWHLGSITKSITATLVARLVESNAVRWDDSVGEILKSVVPDMHDAYKSVTFRHLLSHRAGVPANIPLSEFAKYSREGDSVREERRMYARTALTSQPVGPKERTFTYSNSGYVVAGAMLEAKLDKTWEDLIRAHVFQPLKLGSAGFGAPGEKGALTQPAGHARLSEKLTAMRVGEGPTDNPYVLGPAGRVHMSLDDVLAYLGTHRDEAAFLKPESWHALHTPPFGGDYAMGWMVRTDGNLWHNGSNTLWYAEVQFNRGSGIAAVAATNDGLAAATQGVGRTLLRAARAV